MWVQSSGLPIIIITVTNKDKVTSAKVAWLRNQQWLSRYPRGKNILPMIMDVNSNFTSNHYVICIKRRPTTVEKNPQANAVIGHKLVQELITCLRQSTIQWFPFVVLIPLY